MRPVLASLLFALALSPPVALSLTETLEMSRALRGVVHFTHGAHAFQYDIPCGRCHHNIEPVGPETRTCKGCHLNQSHQGLCDGCHISSRSRNFDEEYEQVLRRLGVERVPYLFKAYHGLCRDCHQESNQTSGTSAPHECGGCHK